MGKIKKTEKIVNNETLLVTVDVSKSKCTAYFRCPDGTEQMPFEFCNNYQGFLKFTHTYGWWKRRKNLKHVVIGFESTGPYAEPLIHYLKRKRVRLVQVNTSHTKKLKEVYDNSPGKTDEKDPKVIADIIELGRVLKVVVPEGTAAELRHLIHARERNNQIKTRLVNQLQDLAYIVFPEFHTVIKNIQSKSAQYLLQNYPKPEDIVQLGIDELTAILKKQSRGRFGTQHAQKLYQAAKQSVGIKQGVTSIVKEIRTLLQATVQQQDFIKETEADITRELAKIPYSKYMLSIKGIGEITVAGIIGEYADFNNFRTKGEIEKFAGLNLFEISSGKHKGQKHISKRGRPLLRKLLFFASLNLIRKDGVFHENYQSYVERGMPKMKALIAISRKLLGVLFALVRDQREFDESYHANKSLIKQAA